MTERHIDDVTGDLIEGRWYRLNLHYGGDSTAVDVQDVDTVLRILRDRLTEDMPSPPLELVVQTWTERPDDEAKRTRFAKYAPEPEPEPEPERVNAAAPADDSPFNPMRSFRNPWPFPVSPASPFIPAGFLRPNLDAQARMVKRRRKYAEAIAEFCGCNDVDTHERIIS